MFRGAICIAGIRTMSTQKDYRRCLEQLAATPPKRKAALVRSLLPGIEAALTSGQTLKDIWEALQTEGLKVSYHTFHMAVWRAKRKRTAPNGWGKQEKRSESQGLGEAGVEAVEERDPLANLKRLEENRPGFQWRGKRRGARVVEKKEGSGEKKKKRWKRRKLQSYITPREGRGLEKIAICEA